MGIKTGKYVYTVLIFFLIFFTKKSIQKNYETQTYSTNIKKNVFYANYRVFKLLIE